MHADDQDIIDDFLLEIAKRGLTLRGQFLSHLIRQALTGTTAPTEQEIANLRHPDPGGKRFGTFWDDQVSW